ncbi:MAG: histidine phosphatase family protein [Armatimonadota bacterium]|nr:histidine phosphatase family protein [Armatimonadota bacterium]MDR7404424.1 histidine phosphatase family protein [Armatimonadota bacterium]
MNLYLVHHAEAVPEERDPARPLTERGWAQARSVARQAVTRAGARPLRIVHSEKLRAAQTAQAWREVLPEVEVTADARLNPSADPGSLVPALAEEGHDLALVGHQPFLNRLAALLLCEDAGRPVLALPAAGVACLERGPHGEWTVRWAIGPDLPGS